MEIANLVVSGAILVCLLFVIGILRDIAAMERFNFHGAEKID